MSRGVFVYPEKMMCTQTIEVQGITLACNLHDHEPDEAHHYRDDKVHFFWEFCSA
jgi:hypothetical protein